MMSPSSSSGITDACSAVALKAGIEAGMGLLVASGAAVLGANKYSSGFRKYLGVSGKVALVVTPTFGAYMLISELTLFDAKRNPANYGIAPDGSELSQQQIMSAPPPVNVVSTLGFHHRAANWAYEYPFRVLAVAGVPLVGSIFWGQTAHDQIKLSQKSSNCVLQRTE